MSLGTFTLAETKLSTMKQFRNTQYYISQDGRVFSKHSNKFLKTFTLNSGYEALKLHTAEGRIASTVHRLVAEVYLGASTLSVDHLNGIKTDNNLSNLEYCSIVENINRANRKNELPRYVSKTSNRLRWITYNYRRTINGKRVTLKTSSNLDVILKFKKDYEEF